MINHHVDMINHHVRMINHHVSMINAVASCPILNIYMTRVVIVVSYCAVSEEKNPPAVLSRLRVAG